MRITYKQQNDDYFINCHSTNMKLKMSKWQNFIICITDFFSSSIYFRMTILKIKYSKLSHERDHDFNHELRDNHDNFWRQSRSRSRRSRDRRTTLASLSRSWSWFKFESRSRNSNPNHAHAYSKPSITTYNTKRTVYVSWKYVTSKCVSFYSETSKHFILWFV